MERDRRLSLVVGGFTLAALGAFAVTVLSLSAEQGLFRPRYRLVAYYQSVQGLLSGAAVRLAGTRVGQVGKVRLDVNPEGEPAVRVELKLDEAVRERITRDSVARIATVGLLGDQIIEISIGTVGSEPLADGEEIATVEPFDLAEVMSRTPALLDSVSSIESRSSSVLERIESLATNLDATVSDFQREQGGKRLAESFRGFNEIVSEIQDGEGALHAMIYDPYEGAVLSNLDRAAVSLANVLNEVEHGEGFLHSLIYEEGTEQDLVFQLLEAGGRLNSVLGKLDRGEGTLGLLLNDPTLYEELKILVGGAGRSTVVRTLIDMSTPGESSN